MRKILYSLLFSLGLCLFQSASAFDIEIIGTPNFSDASNFSSGQVLSLSQTEEDKLGKKFIKAILKQESLLKDPIVQDYIRTLGQRLVRGAHANSKRFHFFVLTDASVNAFAGPSGYVGVNTGLISAMQSEDEVAAVLAHEVAHVTQRHIAQAIDHAKQLRIPTLAGVLAAIALGAGTGNPALGSGAAMASMAGATQSMINFTRSNEEEADRVGLHILYNAGYNPMSMPELFERFQTLQRIYPNDAPVYLRTHPLNSARIAAAEEVAKNLPKRHYRKPYNFSYIQARVNVDTSDNLYETYNYYKDRVNGSKKAKNKLAARYGYSLILLRLKKLKQALTQIDYLIKREPHKTLFLMTKAAILDASNKQSAAVKVLQEAYEFDPKYFPVVLTYGKEMVAAGDNKRAVDFIAKEVRHFPKHAPLYYYLAQAQAKLGEQAQAHQAQAKFYELLGKKQLALMQLQLALKAPQKERYDHLRIQAKIDELRRKMLEEKRRQ